MVAKDVDEYLAGLPQADRTTLSQLRASIHKAAPKAEEVISYQIPTYKQNGMLVHFMAARKHLSFTVISLDVLKTFKAELKPFEISGRTIHFSPENPLPGALVQKMVRARVKENEARVRK